MKRLLLFSAAFPLLLLLFFCGNAGSSEDNRLTEETFNDTTIRPTGMIAYIRNGSEIRLIDSNGNNDRQLWTHPDAKEPLGLFDLAWRPDGKELAFSSAHEALFSYYHADIYSVRADGSGFRKITNAPHYKDYSKYKKGTVTVTVRNNAYTFQQTDASTGVFTINIIGAEKPQQITLPPGSSKTLTFNNVADFGDKAQALVAMYGPLRWMMPGTDVVAGKTIKAPDLLISGNGIELMGAFRPVWNYDGSMLTYRDGVCLIKSVPANPPIGQVVFKPLFEGKNPMGTCTWDLGPTAAMRDQLLYTENESNEVSGIYVMKQGDVHKPAGKLAQFANFQYQIAHDLKWLPDGSGFLYSATNLFADAANIFHYDMRTKQTRQVTQLQGAFARRFSISPSGKWIVYERAKTKDTYENVDLWIVGIDGSAERLLVKNGLGPSWGR